MQSRAGLEGLFYGRSEPRVVELLDVAATVIVARSPARERLLSTNSVRLVMRFSFFLFLDVNKENLNPNNIHHEL